MDISEETKIRATKEEYEAFIALPPTSASPVNFITELFFLTCAMHHVGVGKTIGNRKDYEKRWYDIRKELKKTEADQSWRGVSRRPFLRPARGPRLTDVLLLDSVRGHVRGQYDQDEGTFFFLLPLGAFVA